MKILLLFIVSVLSGCVTTPEHRGQQSSKREFVLMGVRDEGIQLRQFPITVSEAIRQAGGLRNCPDCYKSGGEKLLWETVGEAKIRRGEATLSVKSEDFGSFQMEPDDIVYISHKLI